MALYDQSAFETTEAAEMGTAGFLADAAEMEAEWEARKLVNDAIQEADDARRNDEAAEPSPEEYEAHRLRQLAEASAEANGVGGDLLPGYVTRYVATWGRLAEEERQRA